MLTVPVRQLADVDRAAVERVLAAHPIASAQVAERVSMHGLGVRAEGRLFGYGAHRQTEALLWCGGQVTPLGADKHAIAAFADLVGSWPRVCASIVGPADGVLSLWERLRTSWGPDRTVREDQPLMLLDRQPATAVDPLVRPIRPDEVDLLFPASVAMYTEEVGVSPVGDDGGRAYRARVAEIVRGGRAYARIVDGRVVFKAELAVVTRHTVQLQGVWTHPECRGQGLAAAGLASVVREALRRYAPTVSLYVNGYNEPARHLYDRLGFRRVGTFATVLF
ncbi:MAG TPA: GNAT family N-acetyltransferase [Micromonosporaceae bacterium]|nr:GNAT family N-acetyltransferase [Micromonosporaceae bacterium]HCU49440.1 GNAT family N-acetyltransferase [Micromonosporaceae bacterium]